MSPALNPLKTQFTSPLRSHLRLSIRIRCNQGGTKQKPNPKKKIVLFGRVTTEDGRGDTSSPSSSSPSVWRFVKRLPRKSLALLSNLPLAIGEMAVIGSLMALATFIEQGESLEFYSNKFPEESPILGIFTWKWIVYPGFDHMWTSPVFLGLVVLLASSLMACSYTTQIPLVKIARRWSFVSSPVTIRKQEFTDSRPRASIQDLGAILMGNGYEVFLKGPSLYAFKGLAGRFAPIGVHIALLLIMGGATLTAAGSFKGSIMVPQGLNFVVGDVMAPTGFLSNPLDSFNTEVHVNRFYMEYYESGEVSQFYTDISLFNLEGKEVLRKTIRVNDPLRYGGITIYQTDWGISALQILKNGEGPFNLAVAPLQRSGDFKLFGTFLPTGESDSSSKGVKGISMLARDLQSIVLYDEEGKFAGVRRPSSKLPIEINGTKIVVEDAIGSTGLDLKTDPGVPVVYAGFGALMLTTCISFLSHSQIWALQDGSTVVVGGKTNRAKLEFSQEMNRLLCKVPELASANDAIDS
ncbi:cytochrome c biogenesis protein family [Carex rostrata]